MRFRGAMSSCERAAATRLVPVRPAPEQGRDANGRADLPGNMVANHDAIM
jgi:hypothetical protein